MLTNFQRDTPRSGQENIDELILAPEIESSSDRKTGYLSVTTYQVTATYQVTGRSSGALLSKRSDD